MFSIRIMAISLLIFLIFILAILSFGIKQASIVDNYYHQRDLSPIFYKLNR